MSLTRKFHFQSKLRVGNDFTNFGTEADEEVTVTMVAKVEEMSSRLYAAVDQGTFTDKLPTESLDDIIIEKVKDMDFNIYNIGNILEDSINFYDEMDKFSSVATYNYNMLKGELYNVTEYAVNDDALVRLSTILEMKGETGEGPSMETLERYVRNVETFFGKIMQEIDEHFVPLLRMYIIIVYSDETSRVLEDLEVRFEQMANESFANVSAIRDMYNNNEVIMGTGAASLG
jgi:hypothetical protein